MTAYPLSAIVGQEELIEALLVNAVAPSVGGVLVRGERGTAKSTAVRALAPLLPAVHAAAGQAFCFAPGEAAPDGVVAVDADSAPRPAPLVELPLGTTLDRLVGSLDLGRALAGERAFEAGLLARAHQGILYVDEVNLLPDHLVDALLDAAATGVARVEREAVSVVHAARFLLVGTMNAEEGELRPQLLDRFGLGVEVRAPRDPAQRAEIVRRRLAFDRDRAAFARSWDSAETALAARIATARSLLRRVHLPDRELLRITGACAALGVDGVRGDIVCAQAARALAALDGLDGVDERHVRRAATLALAHRRRRDPLDGRDPRPEDLERALDDPAGDPRNEPPGGGAGGDGGDGNGAGGGPGAGGRRGEPGSGPARAGAGVRASAGHGANAGAGSSAGAEAREDGAPAGASDPDRPRASGDDGFGPAVAAGGGPAGDLPPSPFVAAREGRETPISAHLPLDVLALAGTGVGPRGRRARSRGLDAGAIDSRPARPDSDDVALVASLCAALLHGGSLSRGATRQQPLARGLPRDEIALARERRLPEPSRDGRDAAQGFAGDGRDATLDLAAAGAPPNAGGAAAAIAAAADRGSVAGRFAVAAVARDASTSPELREHVRAGREATLVCLVVDASGSMGARRRIARVKGALIALLRDAYARRDRVAVIAFRDDAAQLLVAPGAPLARAAAALRELPTGGRTPLGAGLDAAALLIRRELVREPHRRAIAVVLTDGRVADSDGAIPRAAARLGGAADVVHVVDTEDGPVRLGLAGALARAAGGRVHRLAAASASTRSAA
jgi:magnesium chelatase subunit D